MRYSLTLSLLFSFSICVYLEINLRSFCTSINQYYMQIVTQPKRELHLNRGRRIFRDTAATCARCMDSPQFQPQIQFQLQLTYGCCDICGFCARSTTRICPSAPQFVSTIAQQILHHSRYVNRLPIGGDHGGIPFKVIVDRLYYCIW